MWAPEADHLNRFDRYINSRTFKHSNDGCNDLRYTQNNVVEASEGVLQNPPSRSDFAPLIIIRLSTGHLTACIFCSMATNFSSSFRCAALVVQRRYGGVHSVEYHPALYGCCVG